MARISGRHRRVGGRDGEKPFAVSFVFIGLQNGQAAIIRPVGVSASIVIERSVPTTFAGYESV
jgi:hypothetical protein